MQLNKPKIILVGAHGRMGKEAAKAITEDKGLTMAAAVTKEDSLQQVINSANANIMLELTGPSTVFTHAKLAINNDLFCIIGASGLKQEQILYLQQACKEKQLGACIIPNFSIASALMSVCSRQIAKYLKEATIVERHHAAKIDAPSATAKHTAQQIAKEYKHKTNQNLTCYYEDGIPIHSIRSSGVIAQQEVFFGQPGETLSINHTTMQRSAFMPGLIMCCHRVLQLKEMIIGLEALMDLDS